MRSAFETAGDIRGVDLLASLVSLWRERGSGTLRFSRSGATAGFAILEGNVVSSLSSQSQFDVAAILTRAGKLDPAAVERLSVPEGGDAEIAALQAGLISGREWKWGQKIRAIEILSDVLGWLEGDYEWDPSEAPASGEWTLPVPRLLLELFLRSRDRTLVEHYLGPADLPLVRAERFEEEFESFGLTPDAASVVRLIDGRATAEEIAAKAPADEFAVLKLLAALTTLGLVHPAEAAPGEAPPRRKRRDRTRESRETPAPIRAVPPEPERPPEPEPPPEPEIREEQEAPGPAPEAGEPPVPEEIEETFPETPPRQIPVDAFSEPERPEPPKPLPVLPFEPAADPADLIRSPYETPGAPEEPGYSIDREPRIDSPLAGGAPPPAGGGRGPGVVLAALLTVLVIAVAFLLVMRSRTGGAPEPAAPPTRTTPAKEVLVFPPAETAVPLPRRARGVSTPPGTVPPVWTPTRPPAPPTARPTLEPTRRPTAAPTRPAPTWTATATATATKTATRPAPTRSPTAKPTSPAPTKTRTLVPTRPAPTKTPTPVPTRPAPTKTRTLVPTRPAPTRTPTPVPTRPAPTKRPPTAVPTRPAPTRPPTPAPVATPAAAAGGSSARADWIRRAESDRQSLSRRRNARYSVQLELACEIETLQKAWAWDKPSGTMWLLTTSYRGRTCFRVLWGHYGTLAQAQAAKARIPGFFVAPGNRPVVVSVR